MNEEEDIGPGYDSSQTTSWKALREAEKLDEVGYISELREYVNVEKDKKKRDSAYFILGWLGYKLESPEAIHAILARLPSEKDKSVLSSMLDCVHRAEIAYTDCVEDVLRLTEDNRWLVRHAAIRALAHAGDGLERVDACLRSILETAKDEYDLLYACMALRADSAPDVIAPLTAIIDQQKRQDVLCVAIGALANIAKQHQTAKYLEVLETKRDSAVKAAAVAAIRRYGDSDAVEAVIKRVKAILARKRKIEVVAVGDNCNPELVDALLYLRRHEAEDKRIPKLFQWVVEKKRDFLQEQEKTWVDSHLQP